MAKGAPIHKLTLLDKPLHESAFVLTVRLNELMDWATAMRDPQNVDELHNMRIAAKRLRYTLEIFVPVLDPAAGSVLKTAEAIQEKIGLIHDCDVLFPLLSETMTREMERERKNAARKGGDAAGPPPFLAAEGLIALMVKKRKERENRYAEFIAFWDALSPEQFASDLQKVVEKAVTVKTKENDAEKA